MSPEPYPTPKPAASATPGTTGRVNPAARVFELRVVDAETGQGLPGARVVCSYVLGRERVQPEATQTDLEGRCSIPLPEGLIGCLDVGAQLDGHARRSLTWLGGYEEPMPTTYVLRLERAGRLGGWVRDQEGRPVPGAEVRVACPMGRADREFAPVYEWAGLPGDSVVSRTDAAGWWSCALIAPGWDRLWIEVRHPAFILADFIADTNEPLTGGPREADPQALAAGEAILVLRPGHRLEGVVLDDQGQPLPQAKVCLFERDDRERATATTDAAGAFQLTSLGPGRARVCAAAPGYAPTARGVDIRSGMDRVVLRLERGGSFRLRVVDERGRPAANVLVAAEPPGRWITAWQAQTDADGRAQLDAIPPHLVSSLRFHAGAEGYFTRREASLPTDVPEPTLTLESSLRVSGQVQDAETGRPVDPFKAIPCAGATSVGYRRSQARRGRDGEYALMFDELVLPLRVRIEAEGYEPVLSPPLKLDPREQRLDFRLRRKDRQRDVQGVVLLPDGQPAAGAHVALLTFECGAVLDRQRFRNDPDLQLAAADDSGRFRFESDPTAHTVAAVHPQGFGRTPTRGESESLVVRLEPWGRVTGRVCTRSTPFAHQELFLITIAAWRFGLEDMPLHYPAFTAQSDDQGRFAFAEVPPGWFELVLSHGLGQPFTHSRWVHVRPGETVEVQLGGSGRLVQGRFAAPEGLFIEGPGRIRHPVLRPPNPPPPAEVRSWELEPAERRRRLDPLESPEWMRWLEAQRRSVPLLVAADGSFQADDVEPGDYTLEAQLLGEPCLDSDPEALMRVAVAASIRQPVSIPATKAGAEVPVDLGVYYFTPT
jgi:protocatechuate 3,4-dioxygenase beta subunit